jgi:hypothetical protein
MNRRSSPAAVLLAALAIACGGGGSSGGGSPIPVIHSFTAGPALIDSPGIVGRGGTSILAWNVAGADALTIDQGVGVVTGTTRSVNPTATTTYTLAASNGGSKWRASHT